MEKCVTRRSGIGHRSLKQSEEYEASEQEPLYARIGQLQATNGTGIGKKDGLARFTVEKRRGLIDLEHPRISIVGQWELLKLFRSSYYY